MKPISLIISLLLLLLSPIFATEVDEQELVNVQKGIDLTLSERFDGAEEIYRGVIKRNPEHPVGYFSLASLYNGMNLHFETDLYTGRVNSNYKKAIELAEMMLAEGGGDPWLYYYLGAAKCHIGFGQNRQGHYFSAITSSIDGISDIEKCLEIDPDFTDAGMLLGGYQYYKSSYLHWLSDNRDSGINLIKQSVLHSKFSKSFSCAALIWIFIDYKKYDKAVKYADLGLERYPGSRYFLWGKAEALFLNKDFKKANDIYRNLEQQLQSDTFKSNINLLSCYVKLVQGALHLNLADEAFEYIAKGLALSPSDSERGGELLAELEELHAEIMGPR